MGVEVELEEERVELGGERERRRGQEARQGKVVGVQGQGEHEGEEGRGVVWREGGEERVEEGRVRVRVMREEARGVGDAGWVAREEGQEAAYVLRAGGEAEADELRVVLLKLGDGSDGDWGHAGSGHGRNSDEGGGRNSSFRCDKVAAA